MLGESRYTGGVWQPAWGEADVDISFSELFNLGLGLVMVPFVITISMRVRETAGRALFLAGYLAVLASYGFTVLEGVGGSIGSALNFLEHVALMGAGVCFAVGVTQTRNHLVREKR